MKSSVHWHSKVFDDLYSCLKSVWEYCGEWSVRRWRGADSRWYCWFTALWNLNIARIRSYLDHPWFYQVITRSWWRLEICNKNNSEIYEYFIYQRNFIKFPIFFVGRCEKWSWQIFPDINLITKRYISDFLGPFSSTQWQ